MRRLCRSVVLAFLALHGSSLVAAQTPTEPPRESQAPSAPPPPSSSEKSPAKPDNDHGSANQGIPPSATSERIEELERRLRQLEAQHDGHDATDSKSGEAKPGETKSGETKGGSKDAYPKGVAIAYSPEGVGIASADGKFSFRFRPIFQIDGRFFLNAGTNTFLLRRVRPAMEGTLFEYFDWRFMPELAGTPNVQDAFVNIRLFKEIQLRAGKFKPPVGLERLLSDPDLPFLERGLPTNLVPDRDIGVQLHGDVLGGTLVYAGGIFNGAGDGVNGDNDNNDKKDLAGRVMIRPFQPLFVPALRKLGLGIAATRGTHIGAIAPYRTPVGTTFFQYVDGVNAGGTSRRIAPQAQYYVGPFGMFFEYTRSTHIVVSPGTSKRLNHDSWQVVGSYFITGEDASPTAVTPKHHLDPRSFGTGAIEVVARFGELRIDGETFSFGLADPNRSARKATNWGVGLNWHLARNFKWMIDYEQTSFQGGAANGGDRQAEILILSRLQAAY